LEVLADFSHLLFVALWAMSGVVGLLAIISPTALEAVSAYGNRIVLQGVQVRADRSWVDIDKFVFAHGRAFGAVVLAVTCYLWLISRHGPEAYSKSTLLAVVAVALMMGIVALRHIVRQSLEIDTRFAEAHADPLTGLANRRAFEREVSRRLTQREQQRPLCLLLMDIDDFKGFNDRFGHSFGDRVLSEIGGTLKGIARRDDFIARWGGDEFALLLGSTSLDEASQIAERFRKAVCDTRLQAADGQEVNLTASIGIAEAEPHDDAASLYGRSDAALYAAKEAGRNCSFRSSGAKGNLARCSAYSGPAGNSQRPS
jgi:diguanylate cyclase (GGDEF)-like protein